MSSERWAAGHSEEQSGFAQCHTEMDFTAFPSFAPSVSECHLGQTPWFSFLLATHSHALWDALGKPGDKSVLLSEEELSHTPAPLAQDKKPCAWEGGLVLCF